jgi:hypothetical protein
VGASWGVKVFCASERVKAVAARIKRQDAPEVVLPINAARVAAGYGSKMFQKCFKMFQKCFKMFQKCFKRQDAPEVVLPSNAARVAAGYGSGNIQ